MTVELRGKRALVTGASGFIGGRLVEALVKQHGVEVRGLVRNFMKAPRLARLAVDMVGGDASVEADVRRAAEGCDLIFHCAYGNSGDQQAQRHGTVGSTQYVLDAALANGARVVNVSTVAVYGATGDGDLTEDSPRPGGGDVYSDSKLEAEGLCRTYANERGLAVSTVQPTMVYGPFGPAWTLRILDDVSNWRVILVDGGTGYCNAVYVDDVVDAMVLAATRDEAIGEEFLISGPSPVTWKQYIGSHADLLEVDGTVELPFAEAARLHAEASKERGLIDNAIAFLKTDEYRWAVGHTLESNAILRAAIRATPGAIKRGMKRLAGRGGSGDGEGSASAPTNEAAAPGAEAAEPKPIQVMPEGFLRMLQAKTHVRTEKARRLLGYEPRFDFEAGFARTADWARWAGIAPDPSSAAGSSNGARSG